MAKNRQNHKDSEVYRLLAAAEVNNFVELGETTGDAPSKFRTWQARAGTVPAQQKIRLSKLLNFRIEWLETGEGPMRPSDLYISREGEVTAHTLPTGSQGERVQLMFDELDEEGQQAIYTNISELFFGKLKMKEEPRGMKKTTLGERIRELRNYLDLNQTEFAKQWGVAQGFLSHVEADHKKPGYEPLEKLITWFGVNANWLFGRGGPMLTKHMDFEFIEIDRLLRDISQCKSGLYEINSEQVQYLTTLNSMDSETKTLLTSIATRLISQ